ncbi:MAG: reactive intermediate/imine deaminase, partial [Salinivirgaceae bacterium]|nr:reactive intermediate/imine deaminase [Salinivirgaceae bacterium]
MKQIISTPNAPQAIGPYSQAVEANGFVFVSGQIPIVPATGQMPDGIEAQTEQVMRNIGAILEAAGLTYSNVVK